ncbi:hypothetical protein QR680_001009 [Steinernema hermaphroditum]|uniref:Receptor ligand binding region domain-containing protein n=1 Tax=Steinernema hermaphroditum TaxID=289476 RepID=A0AA39GWM9_9BILA|nr:hypothetical protein QR680_001009 [Steinernema hermaphroditum]
MRGGLLVLCLAHLLSSSNGYNIGLFMGTDSMEWHSLRHAVDQWNNENAVRSELSLDVVTPAESSSLIESKLCDLIQNNVIAVFVPHSVDDNELQMVYSMCHHFNVPCVTVHGREYFDPEEVSEIVDLLAIWTRDRTVPPIARLRKLPEATSDFQPFLKYIREVLKETNIIIHTNEIGLVHRILSQASGMNMTEAKYSYVVTNTA